MNPKTDIGIAQTIDNKIQFVIKTTLKDLKEWIMNSPYFKSYVQKQMIPHKNSTVEIEVYKTNKDIEQYTKDIHGAIQFNYDKESMKKHNLKLHNWKWV